MYAKVAATLALCLALTSPVWGEPAAHSAASLTKSVARSLKISGAADKRSKRALASAAKAEKTAKEALAKGGPPGPAGPTGPPGSPGSPGTSGATGAPGASMLTGWIRAADLPATGGNYTPLANGAEPGAPRSTLTPNSTVVLRDLFVRVSDAPGSPDARWLIAMGNFPFGAISCEIKGTFSTTCNTGGQTLTLPPGTFYGITIGGFNSPAPTGLDFAYRLVAP